MAFTLTDFVRESNRIEGINREPTDAEIGAHALLLACEHMTIADLEEFVHTVQPDAVLRDRIGLNVRVGSHIAPSGGEEIRAELAGILAYANAGPGGAYRVHHAYETLHPFTDGNGRSGRALWLWMMGDAPIGFLHAWYYQSLQAGR